MLVWSSCDFMSAGWGRGFVCLCNQIQVVGLIALIERYKFGARSKATDPTLGLLGGDSAVSVIATPKFVVNNVSTRACPQWHVCIRHNPSALRV